MAPKKAKRVLSIVNYTEQPVSVSGFSSAEASCVVYPQGRAPVALDISVTQKLTLSSLSSKALSGGKEKEKTEVSFHIPRRVSKKAHWKVLRTADESEHGSPWNVYRLRSSKSESSECEEKVFIFPKRDLACWMRELPDSLPLSDMCIPGTHETMALYGWPFSQCQDVTLTDQFLRGVRIIDIRIVIVKGQLVAYHGATPERATFTSILTALYAYITSPLGKSETIIVSIMEESSFMPYSPLFSEAVHDALFSTPVPSTSTSTSDSDQIDPQSLWYLEPCVPKLGEVRGKLILFSRFGGGPGQELPWDGGLEGMGIHPTWWPNNRREGFEWEMEGTRVRTQDWYGIPTFLSIPEKFEAAVRMLDPVPVDDGQGTKDLAITFLSAANVPMALPSTVACGFGWAGLGLGVEGVNSRVGKWLLQRLSEDVTSASNTSLSDSNDTASEITLFETGGRPTEKATIMETPGPRLRGWVFIDFIRDPTELGVIPLFVECNWRGRVDGEEGWTS